MRITEQSTVADLSKALLESDISLHVALHNWLLKNEIDYQQDEYQRIQAKIDELLTKKFNKEKENEN